jgi:quercetin dioxygenase-like cupin family protein
MGNFPTPPMCFAFVVTPTRSNPKKEWTMSLPQTTDGYAIGQDEGEALWFNGALVLVKATAAQTAGRFTVVEVVAPKGLAAPLHVHRAEDEFFVVLDGEIRFQLGDRVIEGSPGSLVYGPREIGHSFRVESAEARLLLLLGPAGADGFFRDGGKPARSRTVPPADEPFPGPDVLRCHVVERVEPDDQRHRRIL